MVVGASSFRGEPASRLDRSPAWVTNPTHRLGSGRLRSTRQRLAANRSEFFRALPSGPFYGYNRPGVEPSEAIIANWWRQGMMGGAKAHYDGIVAFSQTDFTEDLKKITVPVLVMHGDDDQIVPYADSGPLSAQLVQNGTLKTYKGFPHGMPTTEADTINADLPAFLQSWATRELGVGDSPRVWPA